MIETNMFAQATTVGQLFDALWYSGTEAADTRTKHQMMGDGTDNDPEESFRRTREVAIAHAFQRHEELQKS